MKTKVKAFRNLKKLVKLYSLRIEAGVRYLDRKFGRSKWLRRIDESALELDNAHMCITGQLFGHFWQWAHEGNNEQKAEGLGFYIEDVKDGEYELLTRLWFLKITELKIAAGIPLKFVDDEEEDDN